MTTQEKVAQALIKIGAVGFAPDNPVTFKSGIISPVYVDNRKFPFYPSEWHTVIEGFANLIKEDGIDVDIIAGVEAAGIPHSSGLGFFTKIPSVFVRKAVKDHGTKKLVEGGDVSGKRVLLVEDLVSTGISSLTAVEGLRAEGAIVEDCLVIVSYNFTEAKEAFKNANVRLHTLTSFPVILEEAKKQGLLQGEDLKIVEDWMAKYSL
ncbi:orotate phosphoribosyltransferase [Patescibacteria group bacterium]|nr:orotate phosphoribosyltransferase [Patescibacteria group bacterium]